MLKVAPRACLEGVTPYLPGKPIGEVQRELGIKDVAKLASNENPLGASPRAVREIARWTRRCHLYPEGSSPLLREALARSLGVTPDRIIAGNGSDEIIRLVCEAFLEPGDEVVVSRYGFIRFRQQAALMGANVVEVPMRGWTHDLDAMVAACGPRTKAVFVASPNNPTGTFNTRSEVERLLAGAPRSALVVVDEAYCHFARARRDYPDSVPELLDLNPNLFVLRTFSKAHGLAGLRVGFGVGHPEAVRWLDRIRMPFNVGLLAQHAAQEALKDLAFVARSVRRAEQGIEFLRRSLAGLGLEVHDSAANFLFVETPRDGRALFEALLREGVIVRPLGEYGLPRHLRVSVGTPAQDRRLAAAMAKVLRAREALAQ